MSPALSERLTAVVSALVAIAILGAAVTAQHARTSPLERIASLESDLRYQLDLTFRDDYTAYQSRLGELELTLDAWGKSPRSPEDIELLTTWLRQAIKSTLPGETRTLPALPPFGSARPLVVGGPSRPPAPIEEPAPAPPKSTTPIETTAEASPPSDIMVDPVELAASEGVNETTALQPISDPAADIPDPSAVEQPREPAPAAETAAMPPEHSIAVHPAPTEPLAPAPTIEQTAEHYDEQPAETNAGQPAEPPAPVVLPVATVAEPRVNVNLAELSARIAGYHDGMAELDAVLVAKGELDGPRLARLVKQAESLAVQYRFVRLYADALTPQERRFVPAPRSLSETVAMLSRRVAQAGGSGDVLDDFDANRADEPTLVERLAAVAEAVAEPAQAGERHQQ